MFGILLTCFFLKLLFLFDFFVVIFHVKFFDIHVPDLARLTETVVGAGEVLIRDMESRREIAEGRRLICPIQFRVTIVDVAVRSEEDHLRPAKDWWFALEV